MKFSKVLIMLLVMVMLLTSCQANTEAKAVGVEEVVEVIESVKEGNALQVKDQSKKVSSLTSNNDDETSTDSPKKQTDSLDQKKALSDVSDYNFSVITVGSRAPKYSEAQSSASTLIQYNGGYYLIDCCNW